MILRSKSLALFAVFSLATAVVAQEDDAPQYQDVEGEEIFGPDYQPQAAPEKGLPLYIGRPNAGISAPDSLLLLPQDSFRPMSGTWSLPNEDLQRQLPSEVPLLRDVRRGFQTWQVPRLNPNRRLPAAPVDPGAEMKVHYVLRGPRCGRTPKATKSAAARSASFQQMVGRIRGIVTTDCTAARNVTFRLTARNGSTALGEVSALTGWVYVPMELDGERVQCKGPEDAGLCSQRWQAYDFMRSLSSGDRSIKELKLTRYLDAGPGTDIEFVRGAATGRLVILNEQEDDGRQELIRQQASIQAERCATNLDTVPIYGGVAGTTAEHTLCLADGKSKNAFLAAVPLQSGTAFFAVADYCDGGMDGSELMTALLSNSEAAGVE
ncbi:hypothetical protein [Rhizobium leguminosarum]|uniref:hypothetical protein n=1 Tax=Rhizobium leguminosarum TaxID=384 RepID=UPI001F304F80|nr:hypothetical protein [Rhizobium leguminosarum]UIJ81836.1 hypothetical protein LZK78_11400 [Rhizobium leguminosarum]